MEKTIGVLGGGQLGRMLTEAASRLNVRVVTLDGYTCPAMKINAHNHHVCGSCINPEDIRTLAARCDILTTETEHVDAYAFDEKHGDKFGWELAAKFEAEVQPSWQTLRIIQDKYDQKMHLARRDVAVSQVRLIPYFTISEVRKASETLGYPMMLKSRRDGYDGRGNCPIRDVSEVAYAMEKLKGQRIYAEKWVNFVAELAVMVVKVEDTFLVPDEEWETATVAYPVVETIQKDSICKLVYAPARNISPLVMQRAQNLSRRAVAGFEGRGIFGVELFLLEDGELLVNEIAPRPHNSGHYTIEACAISQFDAHIRAILKLPIPDGSTQMRNPDTFAVMINILGGEQPKSHLRIIEEALSIKGASVHLYGKDDAWPGRKMGHITVIASSMQEVEYRARPLLELVDSSSRAHACVSGKIQSQLCELVH